MIASNMNGFLNRAPAIYIEGTSHCADLYSNEEGDPQGLIEARARIGALVKLWIDEFYANKI